MIVIVDSRELVRDGFKAMFLRLGYPATTTCDSSMEDFLEAISDADLKHVQAFLIGDCRDHAATVSEIRARTKAPLIAVLDQSSLTDILFHFENGADDVIKKPVHVTEILARAAAIRRRSVAEAPKQELGRLRIFNDGRDPEIDGVSFPLPRREPVFLNILHLSAIAAHRAHRFTILFMVCLSKTSTNVSLKAISASCAKNCVLPLAKKSSILSVSLDTA